jgi:hypothetical protein
MMRIVAAEPRTAGGAGARMSPGAGMRMARRAFHARRVQGVRHTSKEHPIANAALAGLRARGWAATRQAAP